MEKGGKTRDVHDRIESECDGLSKHVASTLHVGAQHVLSLALVGRHQCGTVDDGVTSGECLAHQIAVFDVADDEVGHIDAQLGDRRLQFRGISDQKADRMPRIGDGLGGPAANKPRTTGYQNVHAAIVHGESPHLAAGGNGPATGGAPRSPRLGRSSRSRRTARALPRRCRHCKPGHRWHTTRWCGVDTAGR